MDSKNIFDAINRYAIAYKEINDLQVGEENLMPEGDQKTGVFAEFYARLYAQKKFVNRTIEFGAPNQKIWDIRVQGDGVLPEAIIQIKAVSEYAKWNRISIIKPGWTELWLMRLNDGFMPIGFWVFEKCDHYWHGDNIKDAVMPQCENENSGSIIFHGAKNIIDALKSSFQ